MKRERIPSSELTKIVARWTNWNGTQEKETYIRKEGESTRAFLERAKREADWHATLDLRNVDFTDEWNVFDGISLARADFQGSELPSIRGAYLADCDFRDVYVGDFTRCSLREADFSNCDLEGVSFDDCDLANAKLRGARLNLSSHELLAEVLRREAREDWQVAMAGFVAITGKCWSGIVGTDVFTDEQKRWGLGVIAKHVREGDLIYDYPQSFQDACEAVLAKREANAKRQRELRKNGRTAKDRAKGATA